MFNNEQYLGKIQKPNYISDELLKTIDMIAQARDKELMFDKTIIAEVISLNNAETGEYYVKYQNGTFKAYAPTNLNYVYQDGTNVYVKVPGGDFSNKKIIEGKASINSMTETDYDYLSNQAIEIGQIHQDEKEYALPASKDYQERIIYNAEDSKENITFKELFNSFPNIKISAEFMAKNFKNDDIPRFGNYGLKVEFYCKDSNTSTSYSTYTRKLDKINFSGNINEYYTYSPQYATYNFNTSSDILTNIKKISFFVEGYDDTIADLEKNNIFVKNIKISFIDIQDSTGSLYYIGIKSPSGYSFIQDTDKIELEGVFFYSGKNIINKNNCVCHWFKQNPEITLEHERYNEYAGPGWEAIGDNVLDNFYAGYISYTQALDYLDTESENYTWYAENLKKLNSLKSEYEQKLADLDKNAADYEQKKILIIEWYQTEKAKYPVVFKQSSEFNKLVVRGSEVYQKLGIKLVIIYNQGKLFSKEVTIKKNYNSRFDIVKSNEEEGLILKLYDGKDPDEPVVADWYVLKSDGTYYLFNKNKVQINVSEFKYEPQTTFYVNIILENGQKIPFTYILKNFALNGEDVRVNFSGLDTFTYNESGSIITTTLTDFKITPIFSTKENVHITSITWIGPDDLPVLEAEKTIEDSMLTNLRWDKADNSIHFKVLSQFNLKKTLNTLQLKVELSNDKEYTFTKIINFVKQGAVDSEGTSYELKIKQYNSEGQEIVPTPLQCRSNVWSSIYLQPVVSQNGKEIKHGEIYKKDESDTYTYDVNVKIRPINVKAEKYTGFEDKNLVNIFKITKTKPVIKNSVFQDEGQYFVRFEVAVRILKNGNVQQKKIISCYYPIMIAHGDIDISKISKIAIPNTIIYNATDNSISQTSTQAIELIYNGTSLPESSSYYERLNNNITLSTTNNKFFYTPINKYEGAYFPYWKDSENNEGIPEDSSEVQVSMSALVIFLKGRYTYQKYNNFFIQPIVMTLSDEFDDSIQGYNGERITIVSDDNEGTTTVKPKVAIGKTDSDVEIFIGSMIAKESEDVSGFYSYNSEDGTAANVLKSNGNFTLGNGCFTMSVNENGEKNYHMSEDLISYLKLILGL